MDFSVIFYRIGRVERFNSPTPKLDMVGLVKIHPLFFRRVSGFGRVRVWSVQVVRLASRSDICTALSEIHKSGEMDDIKIKFQA